MHFTKKLLTSFDCHCMPTDHVSTSKNHQINRKTETNVFNIDQDKSR